jgi:hypothetical protein
MSPARNSQLEVGQSKMLSNSTDAVHDKSEYLGDSDEL